MRFGVLGTGVVGQTIATKLIELGYEVKMGSRQAGSDKAVAWASAMGERASEGSFSDTAAFGEQVVNATAGMHSVEALRATGAASLSGKVLIDIANPLDFSSGFPPVLSVCNHDSLAEQIQREFPQARVVKTLNTVSADVMVNPGMISGGSTIFVSGNDAAAKQEVSSMLRSFGWQEQDIADLGDIKTARGVEMYLPLWLSLFGVMGTHHFNIRLIREG